MIDYTAQPPDTKWGRANLFNDNAPFPLPAQGALLTTVDGVDVHENDFVRLTPRRTYQASYRGSTNSTGVFFAYENQLLVQSYDALSTQLTCFDYVNNETYYIQTAELTAENIAPAETLPAIIAINGGRVR